ncbi:MAG: hypothetical protein SWK90_17800 [Chloroflexota bacterium]|nr:hypothetical protein [Chloroflexota bacterium]
MNSVNPATLPIEPVIGTLRVAGGTRLEDATPRAAVFTSPSRAARGRADEYLFILLDLTGPALTHLYRELREVVAQTYWSTSGSITAALRRANAAASNHLFQANLHTAPSERCYGGLTCAVLSHSSTPIRDAEIFILQAGPTCACVLHTKYLECFPRGEEQPPPLGIGPVADVHLYHTVVTTGDTLLLASPALMREAGGEAIARVLPRAGVQEVLEGLEQVGAGADFVALVVRWAHPEEKPLISETQVPQPVRRPKREPPRPKPRARPKPARRSGPSLGERMEGSIRSVGRGIAAGLCSIGRRIVASFRSIGRGIAVAGAWLVGGVGTLFRRMLPGLEQETHQRSRPPRPLPRENRTVMMAIAIGIPVVLTIVVALAYLWFGAEARFHSLINQAEGEVVLAQAAGSTSEEARPHWNAVLEYTNAAATLRPDDSTTVVLQAQAQAALDHLDDVIRLMPIQLWDFGAGSVPRQLVVHGRMIFVLDPAGGWVAQLTLNPASDGVGEEQVLVQKRQQIGEGSVGDLVDFAWVDSGGEQQTGSLVILEEGGVLVSYDPAWGDEGGTPQLKRSLLGTPPAGKSKAASSFEDRFYILDTVADQIWRYEPRGDVYPEQPDRYFVIPPPKDMATALDMAIDGNIYILYDDGTILKFLGGELQSFDVRGLPGDISQAVALAVDPNDSSDAVYVADEGNERVVALGPDGMFQGQFRAGEAFTGLEALAVDKAAGQLYVVSQGRLYTASLP